MVMVGTDERLGTARNIHFNEFLLTHSTANSKIHGYDHYVVIVSLHFIRSCVLQQLIDRRLMVYS